MEFDFYINKVLSLDESGFTLLDSGSLKVVSKPGATNFRFQSRGEELSYSHGNKIGEIIDRMGEASSKAQALKATITNYSKFVNSGHRIIFKAEGKFVYGFIKVGKKTLFHRDIFGSIKQINPMCVLDFYVHESCQRNGFGKQIFEKMLEIERIPPRKFAYDRPSPLLISFLRKHYNLTRFQPQNNNFVVFDDYFEDDQSKRQENAIQKGSLEKAPLLAVTQKTEPQEKKEENFAKPPTSGSFRPHTYHYNKRQEFSDLGLRTLDQNEKYSLENLQSSRSKTNYELPEPLHSTKSKSFQRKNSEEREEFRELRPKIINHEENVYAENRLAKRRDLSNPGKINTYEQSVMKPSLNSEKKEDRYQRNQIKSNYNVPDSDKIATTSGYRLTTPWATSSNNEKQKTSNSYGSFYSNLNTTAKKSFLN